MRRLIATLLALPALALAGCGGGDSGTALDTALSYLPRDAVFAAAIDTDLDGDQYKALNRLLNEFAFAGEIRERVREQLERGTGQFDEDIRPLLGNPAVVGATRAPGGEVEVVLAMQAADEDKLGELIERQNAREAGEAAGATLYQAEDTFFAVEGDVIVFATDRRQLAAAVERADGDDHLDEETFGAALEGLPDEAVVRMYTDVEALIRIDPASADARRIKWVAALRTLGASVVARDGALDVEFRLRTEGDLTEADLPIAPGDEAPGVIAREGEIGFGVRDLAHIVRFAENAAQAVDPSGFGEYSQAKRTIDEQLGVSLDDDLIGQLTGEVAASVSPTGGFGVRAQLEDPQAFERTLTRVADVLPSFAQGAGFGAVELTKPRAGGDFYELSEAQGGSVFFGVAGEALVVASGRARAQQLARAEPSEVEGATGSVVTTTDAEQLANQFIAVFGDQLGIPDLGGLGTALVTGPLGDLNGHVSASPEELRGKFTLTVE